MYNRKAVMIYSTLREAYSVDSFEKDRKTSKSRRKIKYEEVEDFGNEPESPRTSSEKSVKTVPSVPPVPPVPLTPNVPQTQSNIQPYYDEELEKYLNINDFKSISETQYIPQNFQQNSMPNQQTQTQSSQQFQPVTQTRPFYTSQQVPVHAPPQPQPVQPVQQPQPVPVQPVQPVQPVPVQQPQPVQPVQQPQQPQPVQQSQETRASVSESSTKKDIFYKNLINIGLFALIGILIIFLCDQITEIAINIGMKKTVFILEPFLQELQLRKDRLQAD
jgi:hypothetical protein